MDLLEYEKIKTKYGSMSSWAIWSEQGENIKSNMGNISFFENPTITTLKSLNPNIILVVCLNIFFGFDPSVPSPSLIIPVKYDTFKEFNLFAFNLIYLLFILHNKN